MESKLNILFISSWYPNRINPYLGNFVKRHAEAISLNCTVTTLSFQSEKNINSIKIEEAQINPNLKEVVCYFPQSNYSFFSIFSNYKNIVKGYKLVIKNKIVDENFFDILHLNIAFPIGLITRHIQKKLPIVVTEHSTKYLKIRRDFSFLEKIIIKQTLKIANVVCPVSNDLAKNMKELFQINTTKVIPNCVNENYFKINNNVNSKITFIHISTLNQEHKNIRGIIEVISKLSLNRNDFSLKIIGDGDPYELYSAIKDFKIKDGIIEFKGALPIKEVAKELSNSDLLILFSNYENSPCVISEAHMCGIPVISTNVGGISDMINNDNGILIDKNDTAKLFDELNNFLNNHYTFNKESIAKSANKKYSFNSVSNEYFSVYKSLLKR